MRQLSEILRLKHQGGLSHARIAAALDLSKGVVNKYVSLARAKGVGWPLPEGMDEAALERLLFPAPVLPGRGAEPAYDTIHQELKRKGVTLQLLWAEYAAAHGEGALRYSQFCERYRRWRALQRRSMRQQHRAEALDYQGPPFNWVTMPDQYVWSFFENEVRANSDQPLFAKLALISSHAPWVPVLSVVDDWDTIGDGSIFEQWDGKGESPQSLWQDHDRVREHFARSVAYAVEVAAGYAERYVDKHTLLIIIGDHQPAPIITGPDPSPAVPVHVISGDPALVEPFRRYGFVDGAVPADEFTDQSMAEFRRWLHESFGATAVENARRHDIAD